MKSPTLNNSTKRYLEDKAKKIRPSCPKDRMMRFDLAEGLWEKSKIASLPDRTAIAVKAAVGKFLKVRPSQISVFAGADEVLEIIPRIYLNQKEPIVVITPVFDRVITTNTKVGARVLSFPLKESNNFKFRSEDLKSLRLQVEKESPQIVWFCSPNNPTGQVVDKEYIQKIARGFPGVLVVVDEAYQEYFSLSPTKSSVSIVDKCNNLIVIRSFSKAFGLAGARIGYVVSNEHEISRFENYRTMFNVSTTAQDMAIESLSRVGLKRIKTSIKKVVLERERIISEIKNMKNIKIIDGPQTNFLFLKHKTKDLFETLYSRGIVGSDWRTAPGVIGEGFVRISINKPTINRRLITILKGIN